MKILSASIEWHLEFDNPASLRVKVDSLPHDQLRYEKRGRYYFGVTDCGYASFLYDDPNDHAGFGGRSFDLTMKDGSKVVLVGPWSGNPMGAAAEGFPMTYDVHAEVPSQWANGNPYIGHVAINLTEPVWLEAIRQFCPEAEAAEAIVAKPYCNQLSIEQNLPIGGQEGVRVLEIVRKGMTSAETHAYKRVLRFARYAREVRDEERRYETPAAERLRHMTYVNELVSEHRLERFGLALFDLNNPPPFLPPPPPRPPSPDPEDEDFPLEDEG